MGFTLECLQKVTNETMGKSIQDTENMAKIVLIMENIIKNIFHRNQICEEMGC